MSKKEKDLGKVKRIGTHRRAHVEEAVAVAMLFQVLPVKPEIFFIGNVNKTLKDQDDTIFIGVGGGEFDEHPTGSEGRKEGECSATLVAKYFGFNEDPCWSKILADALYNDLKGPKKRTDIDFIGCRMKSMYEHKEESEVFQWALDAISDLYYEKETMLKGTVQFKEEAKIEKIAFDGKSFEIATVRSDKRVITRIAKSAGIDLLVKQEPSGNVQILPTKPDSHLLHMLKGLARVLRIEGYQIMKSGISEPHKLWKEFEEEKSPKEPYWFFHKSGGQILNGGETAVVPPTRIKLSRILQLAVLTLDDNAKYRNCKPLSVDQCAKCPFHVFEYGMSHCRKERYDLFARSEKSARHAPERTREAVAMSA